MNEAQNDIYEDMQAAWVSKKYNDAFRKDCERLVAAGNIVVDIGQALKTLKASPELCDVFTKLLQGEPHEELPPLGDSKMPVATPVAPQCETCSGDRYINTHSNVADVPCPDCGDAN